MTSKAVRVGLPRSFTGGEMTDWTCKRCGGVEGLVQFRVMPLPDGRSVKRRMCRVCENATNAERAREARGVRAPFAVVLGDTHFPFAHEAAVRWAVDMVATVGPRYVVQVGDLYDRYSQSKFPRNHSIITPGEELERGREAAEAMWQSIRARSPSSKCYQLLGNHDDRPLKRVLEKAPELMELVGPSLRDLHTFPGVTTIHDSRDELVLDGVVFQHGHNPRLGYHASFNQRPTVHGHTHHGGTWFRTDGRGHLWELDAGCLVDLASPVFDYRSQKKLVGVTVGVGVIDSLGPRWVPYVPATPKG